MKTRNSQNLGSTFRKSVKRSSSIEANPELCREVSRTIETDKESTFSRGKMRNFTAKDITLECFSTIQPEPRGTSRFEPKSYKPIKKLAMHRRFRPQTHSSIETTSVNSRVS